MSELAGGSTPITPERERETARVLIAGTLADKDAPPGTRPWAHHRLDQAREISSRITQDLRSLRSIIVELRDGKAEKVLGWDELGFEELIYQKVGIFPNVLNALLQSDSLVTLGSLVDVAQTERKAIND